MRTIIWAVLSCLLTMFTLQAPAQTFPAKPIRIIVPFPAGGTSDILTRLIGATLPHTKSGRLRLIAVSSDKRFPSLPDTPVVAETPGLEGFVTGSWQGVLAPAKTPPEVVAKLQAEIARIINQPDMKEKLSSQGADPIGNSPAEMAKWLAAEKDRWAKLIKATGFQLEQ